MTKLKHILTALLTLLAITVGLSATPSVEATEITNYTNSTTILYNGQPLDGTTGATPVEDYKRMAITSNFEFPDDQPIAAGDTLVMTIPKELRFYGAIAPFNVTNDAGDVVGVATVNAQTQPNTVTVTFTDQFSKVPENKKMHLNFELVVNQDLLKSGDQVNTTIGGSPLSFTYIPKVRVGIDAKVFKYSYKDAADPDIIHWVAIVNAGQDPITNMVITDTLGDFQTFIPGSLKFSRLEILVNDPVDNENEARGRAVVADHASEVVYNATNNQMTFTDSVGYISTIGGQDYGHAYYIRYASKIDRSKSGDTNTFTNAITLSGSNITSTSKDAVYNEEKGTGNATSSKSENVVLKTKKNISGQEASLAAGQFSFDLYDDNDLSKPIQTKSNAADGTVSFDALKYSQAGTYHYTIKEVIPAKSDQVPGYTYDTNEVKVTVTVTQEKNGVFMGAVAYGAVTEFTNTYKATTSVSGTKKWVNDDPNTRPKDIKVQLYANGTALDGKVTTLDANNNYRFDNLDKYDAAGNLITYTVQEVNPPKGYQVTYDDTGLNITNTYQANPVKESFSVSKTLSGRDLVAGEFNFTLSDEQGHKVETVTNDAAGKVHFSELTFDKVGTYLYTISEDNNALAGVTYDKTAIDVTIKVTDNGKGQLESQVTYKNNDQVFENSYHSKAAKAKLDLKKVLSGRELKAKEFAFILKDEKGKDIEKVSNDANGHINFAELSFDKVGSYKYTVSEENNALAGVSYDKSAIQVTITVTDNGQGQLVAQVAYNENDQSFENSYQPASTKANISVNKNLRGRALKADEFSFNLMDANGQVLETVKNDAQGKVNFSDISYDKAGSYQYTITEENTGLAGVVYDKTPIQVTVTVTDDGKGQLHTAVAYKDMDTSFDNSYLPDGAGAYISATKVLTGRALKDGEFSFSLQDQDGKEIEKVTNDSQGKINFAKLNYDKVGVYHYTISEINNGLAGVTYDKQAIQVTVTVTDDGQGKLIATVSYQDNDQVFKNNFKPKTPDHPKTPDKPKTPIEKIIKKISKMLPSTGDSSSLILSLLGITALAGFLVLYKKSK